VSPNRTFQLSAILSIVCDRNIIRPGMTGQQGMREYHELMRQLLGYEPGSGDTWLMQPICAEALVGQFPWLSQISMPEVGGPAKWQLWLAQMEREHGASHEVRPM